MTVKVILNPYSNRWKAQKRWVEAESVLKRVGISFDLSISEYPDHVEELAATAVSTGFTTILVAGGDGTIGDVVNGAAKNWDERSRFPITLGLLPLGTANDLADNIGSPREFVKVAKMIMGRKTRMIDLGKCNDRYFINNSAAGLEPYVTVKQEKIRWITGIPRYLLAAVMGIMDKPNWNVRMEWDGGSYNGPLTLISVGNGRRTGGVFFMTPNADPFDGKLTFMHGYRESRGGMFKALPSAMKDKEGTLVELNGMREVHCTRLNFKLDKPSPAHTDGELFPSWISDFEYRLFPSALRIMVP